MKSYDQKQEYLKKIFSACTTPEETYKRIISWGKELPPIESQYAREAHRIRGCQSTLYLKATYDATTNTMHFGAQSDALITRGLSYLLIYLYDGEPPKTLFTHPPTLLTELQIPALLSPNRASGLQSLWQAMQKAAAKQINT